MTGSVTAPARQPRRMVPLAFGAAGLGLVALSVGLAMAVRGSDAADPLLTYAVVMTAACAAAVWGLWLAVDRYLLRAAETLSREAGLIAHGNAEGMVGGRVPLARYGDLQPIARAVNDLSDKLAQVRRDIARTVAESTAKAEEQKTQLAAVLRDLHEGVLVCNTRHQILLYNQTALDILHLTGELGLGRSMLHFVVAEPLTHTLERLTLRVREGRHVNHEHGTTAQFVGATTDGRILLEGRMSAILQDPDPASDEPPAITGPIITGYVLTLSDATSELAALGQRDALLREATEGFRAPIANLRAAVETLYDAPDLGPGDRAAFESAMMESCDSLSRRLEQVTAAYRSVVTGSWPMSDIHSNNLINLVAHRVGTETPTRVTLTGLPQWVHGDSHGLVLLFAYLIEKVHGLTGATAFDLEAAGPQDGDRWVYLDLVWEGPAVPSATLDGWLEQTLPGGLGGLSAGDVLQHHRSTAWSEPLAAPNGTAVRARLRVPLPPAQSPLPSANAPSTNQAAGQTPGQTGGQAIVNVPAPPPEDDEEASPQDPTPLNAAANPPAAPAAPTATVPANGKVYGTLNTNAKLVLKATQESWLQVRDGSEIVFTRVLKPGDTFRVPDKPNVKIRTGNAGGLVVMADGGESPPLGSVGQVLRDVAIDSHGVVRR